MEVCISILTAIIVYIIAEIIQFLVKKTVLYIKEAKHKRLEKALDYLLQHERTLLNELLAQQEEKNKENRK